MELKAQQASLNIDEQIENLKSLGLIIGDEEYAKKIWVFDKKVVPLQPNYDY